MKISWKNDITTLLLRLLLVYALLFACRVVFYAMNRETLGALTGSELPELLHGSLVFDTVSILYANGLFIILSLLPWHLRERKWYQRLLFWLYLIVNSGVILINLSDSVYFHYAKKRFTSDEFHFTQNDNTLTVLGKALSEHWALALIAIGLIAALILLYRRIGYRPLRIRRAAGFYGVSLVALVTALGLSVVAIRGGIDRSTRPITLSNALEYTSSQTKSSLILSNPFCVIRTLGNKPFDVKTYFTATELDSIYTPYHYPDSTFRSIGKRNIVIFTLESFSREHSTLLNPDLYPPTEHYMPFLDSLMQHGYTFTDGFASGRKSIDALPSILASIPSYQTPFVLLPQALGDIEALPRILGEQGYTTAFFCGSQRSSMGFTAFGRSAGIQQFFTREDYESERGTSDYDNFWGIWDEPFLQFMASKIDALPQPFLTDVFTLSSHHPFVVPEKYENILPKGHTQAHKPVSYTDLSVRRFFEYARRQPWYQNTIFVFTGDHVSSEVYADKTRTATGNTAITLFIYTPDGAIKGFDSTPTQQADLMPTLLGLTGNRRPYFAFGRDVFNEPHRPCFSMNYTEGVYQIITDSLAYFFDANTDRPRAAYGRSDLMQTQNLLDATSPYQQYTERLLKAVVQSYGEHVSKQNFTVPMRQK